MSINIRTKGATAELEICKLLEPVVREAMMQFGRKVPDTAIIQRNQNQSAVGGSDLSNTFGLCIEVKRQETLAINDWWKQCSEAAVRNAEIPVLLYRQSNKKWQAVMNVEMNCGHFLFQCRVRATVSIDDFLVFFKNHVYNCLLNDLHVPRF